MINPPFPGAFPEPPFPDANMPPIEEPMPPPPPTSPNVQVTEEEAKAIVTACNAFKTSMRNFAKQKKKVMKDSYAYTKSKFIGNDLLALPASEGSDKDIQSNRPQIFIPKIRQMVKTLYSYMKLTLFPNDEDYFRVRSKTSLGAELEDDLTDALKYKFKEALITEKMGLFLLDIICMGNAPCLPKMRKEKVIEWVLDPVGGQYMPTEIAPTPVPDLEVLDPLHFYVDPKCKDPDQAKWGYFGDKRKQELKDSELYMNTGPELDKLSGRTVKDAQNDEEKTFEFTDLNSQYEDIEDVVDYDLYYFPFLKLSTGRELRNILVGVAGGELLVRIHPNTFPRGMNPLVFTTWMEDPKSPYGVGPVEDTMELQRLINMIYNHTIETLARIGNRYAVSEEVDLSTVFGVAGGVMVTKGEPSKSVMAITGDYAEPAALMNFTGTLSAELQQVGGAQNPFQGSANVDFKKTATELQILQENSISIIREVVEHISVMGIQRILERLMYLCAMEYSEPIEVRVDQPGVIGPVFKVVDLSVLKSGQFTIELVSVNPSQSKQAQVESLSQLIPLIAQNPMALQVLEPLLVKIGTLQGVKDTAQILQEIKEAMGMLNGAPPPGIQNPQAGMEPPPVPGMEGAPPPVI